MFYKDVLSNWNVVVIGIVFDEFINLNVLKVIIWLNVYFVFDMSENINVIFFGKFIFLNSVRIIVKIKVLIVVLKIWLIGCLLNLEVIVGNNF